MRIRSNTLFRESDGDFTVVAERRTNRKNFRIRAWFQGCSRIEETATTEEAAVEAAKNVWFQYLDGIFDNPEEQPHTLGEMVAAALARTDIRATTLASYRWVLNLMVAALGSDVPLESIRRRQIEHWLDGMDCKDVSKASYLRTAKAIFAWAIARKWIRTNPCAGLKYSQKHAMRPWLEEREWKPFLDACQPAFRIRAAFVLETGLRKAEIINARWSWIKTANGRTCISVQADPDTGFVPKSGRPRMIPLTERALAVLNDARERWGDEGYIFFKERTAWPNLTRETHKACRKAGVSDIDFHGLRRSAGGRWLANGIAIQDVSALLGHRDISTTLKHYAGIADSHLSSCMDMLDRKVAAENRPNIVQFPASAKEWIPT